mmetsp:Transcript_11144/g.29650  ORF Transcript_11144/g.29650 Transcript_11144/m.29650 type:complete len:814 (-) Transcript_11144:161-2602(-)
MLCPDLQFMVHSSEIIDEEGFAHRGSKISTVDWASAAGPPPQWRLRDFGFAAYSSPQGFGVREVHFGRRSVWVFAAPREHCEEIVVFRRGQDTRRKWDEDAMHEPKAGIDMFFVMRMRQITKDTPLAKQFNGEWGFWESFYAPLIDEEQTMRSLSLMDPAMAEEYFAPLRLSVVCHECPPGQRVLTVPEDLVVRYEVKVVCKDMDTWSDLCTKIGEDMILQDACIVEHKHLKAGDECVGAFHEKVGHQEHSRLIKRDFEQLKLPVVLTFMVDMQVATQWKPDLISLQYKYDFLAQVYTSNLMGGFSSMSGARADPWNPMARLAISALNKVLARFPDIHTILDAGCGDMAWMQFFLKDHPGLSYVGVDIVPYCLAVNFKRFPRLHFVQTDLSNSSGIEVLPQGCDLVLAKDVLNHMVLPDAIAALRRLLATRPRFLLTHVHGDCDNTGWERRIDKHLHYTRYDYNKPPFSLPYPSVDVQRVSDQDYFVLYEVVPDGECRPPPQVERQRPPQVAKDLEAYSLIASGDQVEPAAAAAPPESEAAPAATDDLGPKPTPQERTTLAPPVTELPDRDEAVAAAPERKPIKGIPAVEFRARCDLIFDRFDKDKDGALCFEELADVMETGGRRIEQYDSYVSLCSRLNGVDPRVGLRRKDVYSLFEKAPQNVWEEVYRSINPLAQMVKRGPDRLPDTFLERPLASFLFEDDTQFARVHIELNAHLFYGAAEVITEDHVQAYFGKQRLELHIVAPGSYGAQDLYTWKFIVTPLSAEVVPEDCQLEMKDTKGRFGSKKITLKLMKSKQKKWYKVGQAVTGQRV